MPHDVSSHRNQDLPVSITRVADSDPLVPRTLPAQLTPFIGRTQETAKVIAALRKDGVRLVTLIGPGGIGKTRLALNVALQVLSDYDQGVSFVSLGAITDRDQIVPAIVRALGIRGLAGRAPVDGLRAFLAPRHLLLTLDNFEQVLPGATLISDLLSACPHITVLVTSRIPLHLYGEHLIKVPPLALPGEDESASEITEAITLFIDRAQAIDDGFARTAANAGVITAICRQLDGLPLAIELAVARLRIFPLPSLLEQLEHPLDFLVGGADDQPERLRTMRDAIAWSYALLQTREQALVRALSIFAGGFTLEAATAIAADSGLSATESLEAFTTLVDASLLNRDDHWRDVPHFTMLETIREFAHRQLTDRTEEEEARQRHAVFFLSRAQSVELEWIVPNTSRVSMILVRERDNIRTALEWFESRGEIASALKMVGALWQLWFDWGDLVTARDRINSLLAMNSAADDPAAWAKATGVDGALAQALGEHEMARTQSETALRVFREIGDSRGAAATLQTLGLLAMVSHDFDQAERLLRESQELFQQNGDRRAGSWCLRHLGSIAYRRGAMMQTMERAAAGLIYARRGGSPAEIAGLLHTLGLGMAGHGNWRGATAAWNESLALFREIGSRWGEANCLASLGNAADEMVATDDATALWRESLAFYRGIGDPEGTALVLSFLAWSTREQGNLAESTRLFEEALGLSQGNAARWRNTDAILGLSALHLDRDETGPALDLLANALATAQTLHDSVAAAATIEWIAHLLARDGRYERATELLGAVAARRASLGINSARYQRAQHEPTLQSLRHRLGPDTFSTAWQRGEAKPFEASVSAAAAYLGAPAVDDGDTASASAGLTRRELDVLRLLVEDAHLTDREIAGALFVSPRTVGSHVSNILHKLGVETRRAARDYAREHGIV